MTRELLELIPPFDGELYSEAWWQRVAPNLTPDGRALVQKTLTAAADRLGEVERVKFEAALRALQPPTSEQLAFLRSPRDPTAQQNLLQDDRWDLSKILICDPEIGEAIEWNDYQFFSVTFENAVFIGDTKFERTQFAGEVYFTKAHFVGEASFFNARFANMAYFLGVQFTGKAIFNMAQFEAVPNIPFLDASTFALVVFASSRFAGQANFFQAQFTGAVNFCSVQFAHKTNFFGARFKRKADFIQALFADEVIFHEVQFAGEADFRKATFTGEAAFWKAQFASKANFQEATFTGEASFWGATFTGKADFWGSTFAGEARFDQAEFIDMAIFEGASFTGVADFHAARFSKTVSFRGSKWRAVPDFVGTAFKDGMAIADLENLQTSLTNHTLDWRNDPTRTPITDRLQALRKMAHDADDRPRELDYFALELQSRYQAKKKLVAEGDDTSQETEDGDTNRDSEQDRGWLWPKRQLIWLYGLFSDYGRGIGRPFGWLVGLWVGCALGYAWQAVCWCTGSFLEDLATLLSQVYTNALLLSLVNALPALGVASEARKSSLETLYRTDVPAIVHGIGIFEGVAAILLLFLIGLGLRNRFRL
ncbi:MAG: pentapeptide repeat-containing protein [Alphaproteobacteria bacterium]|nr:pentapeptide repeat-containing protein [Alphaproteobacteria bacterium]